MESINQMQAGMKNKANVEKRGAEAKVYFSKIFGRDVVIKSRERKKYRNPVLDYNLRKTRNKTEARCVLSCLKNEIPVPFVYHVGEFEIIYEKLEGKLLKDFKKVKPKEYKNLGKILARMHEIGITHGDFTPANVMITKKGPYIIDFGLATFSKDTEEKAVDLLLMKKNIGNNFKYFLEGYKEMKKWKRVLDNMNEIEKRGRYRIRKEEREEETD
jgi:Kae1-associated kinase Bud32